jgi:DNA mismatch repair protein MutS2
MESVQNAAMQFDDEHLTPLFTLEMGIPGSSYTFEICRRLGLDPQIIETAVRKSGEEIFKLDRLLSDVVAKSREYKEKYRQITIRESELNSLVQLYRDNYDALRKQRRKLEKEAAKEARKILEDANRTLENAIREIRESGADKKVVRNARKLIQDQKTALSQQIGEDKRTPRLSIDQLKPGMKARSAKFDVSGSISNVFPRKKQVTLERDGMTITIDFSDIELLEGQPVPPHHEPATVRSGMAPPSNVPNELDLRGLPVEEALEAVASYLDKALHSSWDEVRIIHGKGTGALKEAVHRYLAGQKHISSYRLGNWGEGDTGVTVVKISE